MPPTWVPGERLSFCLRVLGVGVACCITNWQLAAIDRRVDGTASDAPAPVGRAQGFQRRRPFEGPSD